MIAQAENAEKRVNMSLRDIETRLRFIPAYVEKVKERCTEAAKLGETSFLVQMNESHHLIPVMQHLVEVFIELGFRVDLSPIVAERHNGMKYINLSWSE